MDEGGSVSILPEKTPPPPKINDVCPAGYNHNWTEVIFAMYVISVQAQYGRPPGIKDVLYDERGNVVAVMKISPDKLPSHR